MIPFSAQTDLQSDSQGNLGFWTLLSCIITFFPSMINGESAMLAEHGYHHYTNEWVVRIPQDSLASEISNKKGFTYVNRIEGFDDMHLFVKESQPKMQKVPSHHLSAHLESHEAVLWAEQQVAKVRQRRGLLNRREGILARRETDRSRYEGVFNDEYWKLQWYEQDYRAKNTKFPTLDMGLVPVYTELNITGRGVRVCVIDDGLEYTHDDLKDNFDPEISYNLNNSTFDVLPRYEDPINAHGTRCAGEIAMKANNSKCGVGIAFNAKVGGIKLLDGPTTDLMEAKAIQYALDKVDIFTGSWGPLDNGLVVDGPGKLASLALENGILKGRKGRGALYFFAGGNGKVSDDNCACDGYASSIYTITVASATELGKPTYYSERCSAVMVTTYSGGSTGQIKIVTTDLHNDCTVSHTGTSAAAPLGAGIAALLLEANPLLTWRDVQHLLVHTVEVAPIANDVEWRQNAAGFWYSINFGFGLMNAYQLIKQAMQWTTVPPKTICTVPFYLIHSMRQFSPSADFITSVKTDACGIRFVEHVQLRSTINHTRRGAIEVYLQSPSGTISKLLEARERDQSNHGFRNWPFLTLEFWGENPSGLWRGMVRDVSSREHHDGEVESMTLVIHGTVDEPEHYKNGPRKYDPFDVPEDYDEPDAYEALKAEQEHDAQQKHQFTDKLKIPTLEDGIKLLNNGFNFAKNLI
nr:PREDICTED: neuroendocrine convertase 1-like [Bemisia tabaci]